MLRAAEAELAEGTVVPAVREPVAGEEGGDVQGGTDTPTAAAAAAAGPALTSKEIAAKYKF